MYNIFKSQKFLFVSVGVLALLVLLIITFRVGIAVGYRQASFVNEWRENYERNFIGGPRILMGVRDRDVMPNHGTLGQIIKIGDQTILVRTPAGNESVVLVTGNTVIKEFEQTIATSGLAVDSNIAVIGTPGAQGQIEAKFIRVLPEPGFGVPTSTVFVASSSVR